jgi:hypothetical protein
LVDHIDNNKLNNKLNNLQLTTNRINSTKDRVGPTSKFIGVGFHKSTNKWRSRIQIDGKNIWLGVFVTEIEASNAYQNALKSISST